MTSSQKKGNSSSHLIDCTGPRYPKSAAYSIRSSQAAVELA